MIRVLHVLGSLNRGGVETWLMHVLRHIDRDAFQLDFCCLSGDEGVFAPEAKSLGSQVFSIKLKGNLISFNRQFVRLLQKQKYDVVHSHVHHFSGYILQCSRKADIRSRIAHSHSAPLYSNTPLFRRTYLRYMERSIKQFATIGLGVSNEAMRALFSDDWNSDERWRLLYCGIDSSSFKFSDRDARTIREQYSIPAHANVIGHVGSFSEPKNHRFMLKMAKTINHYRDDVWFLFVGDGLLMSDIERQADREGIPRLIFAGEQSNVAAFLAAMNLFLFPSKWEGLPLSVVEAQANGLRCLCSDEVTREVEVVPTAVSFLSLDLPVVEWTQKSQSLLVASNIDRRTAWRVVAASPFAIENSVQELSRIYKGISG
jgi:glycosyltransferase involved in cell wall biosynthesis